MKTSRWDGQRYQFALRGSDADLLVLVCWNGAPHCYVIPFRLAKRLTFIKITSRDPAQYAGQWARFYEDWGG